MALPPASFSRLVTSSSNVPDPMVAINVDVSIEKCWKFFMSITIAPLVPPIPNNSKLGSVCTARLWHTIIPITVPTTSGLHLEIGCRCKLDDFGDLLWSLRVCYRSWNYRVIEVVRLGVFELVEEFGRESHEMVLSLESD